ncbi:MAG TPA: hypothetical protein VJ697_10395 [Nitrososphaeraceae archaeon]|nr:hypothetical protein [Nitrososphaeraceae archaeon]
MSFIKKDGLIVNSENSSELTENFFIDNQKKQVENILSTISYTANNFNSTICKNFIDYSIFNLKIMKTMKDTQNKIITIIKEFSYNFIEIQKNVININQYTYSHFFINLYKSYLEIFDNQEKYSK